MKRTLVISDIHGELEKFNHLLEKAGFDVNKDQLILLGDYIDRGPDPKGVLNRVMELKEQGAIVLKGNHDEMMKAAANQEPGAWERWEKNGAMYTLKSYDPSIEIMGIPNDNTFQRHISFIKEMDYYYQTDDYIFVHAGVDPDIPVEETDPYTLVWIREQFHHGYQGGKTVVFGHTPTAYFHGKGNDDVYYGKNNIIGIDGGAVYGGQLNCLELETNHVYAVR
jgi:serine/threonine protein phosphatase 1